MRTGVKLKLAKMKYLNVPELAALTNCISGRIVGDIVLDGRVEAYSCEFECDP